MEKTLDLQEHIEKGVEKIVEDTIKATFRNPKDGEGRWGSSSEILAHFGSIYSYFDPKKATPTTLGKAMNNHRFSFKNRRLSNSTEYWLEEK